MSIDSSDSNCGILRVDDQQSPSLVQGSSSSQRVLEWLDDGPSGDEPAMATPTPTEHISCAHIGGEKCDGFMSKIQVHFQSIGRSIGLLAAHQAMANGRTLTLVFLIALIIMCTGLCFIASVRMGWGNSMRSQPSNQRERLQDPSSGAMRWEAPLSKPAGRVDSHPASPQPINSSPPFGGGSNMQERSPLPSKSPPHSPQDNSNPSICPELVVPEGCECSLLVPRLPPKGAGNEGKISVADAMGVSIFQAEFRPSLIGQADGKRMILTSSATENIFATCRDAKPVAPPADREGYGLMIHNHLEQPIGVLRSETPARSSYTLLTRQGVRIQVQGDIKAGAVTITDQQGRLLATAETKGTTNGGLRSVRVGPLVDAGLMVLSILGIDLLEHDAAVRSRTG